MPTVVLVHGTGTREESFSQMVRDVTASVDHARPDVDVIACSWGSHVGARLNANGGSIPLFAETSVSNQPSLALWEVLYRDPLHELRLMSLRPTTAASTFGASPTAAIDAQMSRLDDLLPSISAIRSDEFILPLLLAARDAVLSNELYRRASEASTGTLSDFRDSVARALVAITIQSIKNHETYHRIAADPDLRDEVVSGIQQQLADEELGLGSWLGACFKKVAAPLVTGFLSRRRGSLTDSVAPFPGDVLLYQARGEEIHSYIRTAIESATPPVILLAHSLGGIACVDLLVENRFPMVSHLITVGSQAPFLYEINALRSLRYGDRLPEHFPLWLNIYDLKDILSYVGANVFPGRVDDVLVDNRQPFPESHSAYWSNPSTWNAIFNRIDSE